MPLNEHQQCIWGPQTQRGGRDYQLDTTLQIGPGDTTRQYSQQASVSLEITAAGYTQPVNVTNPSEGDECYVVVDLANSLVTPGPLAGTDDSNRGWYTHAVEVSMRFLDASAPYVIDVDTPQSSAATGSESQSDSETIGFFGDQLTGTATTGESTTRTFGDFEVTNTTVKGPPAPHPVMTHHLALKVSDGGGGYTGPFSLINDKHELSGLVPRSAGNNPLTSAACFLAQMPQKQLPATATLDVVIKHWLALVVWHDGDGGVGDETSDVDDFPLPDAASAAASWKSYAGWTGIWWAVIQAEQSSWSFAVDFQNGKLDWA
jgi:hypothetical protein